MYGTMAEGVYEMEVIEESAHGAIVGIRMYMWDGCTVYGVC